MTSYVVYGAGAVGGVIGGHLHRVGHDVTLIARGDHLAAIREGGLVLDTQGERLVVPAVATDTAAEVDWRDDTVVLLTVKSHQTAIALADLVAHAPAAITVVCAQNGVSNEAAALRLFERVHGLTVMLPAGHLEPGIVVQGSWPTPGILDLGRYPATAEPDAGSARIAADLRRAGFESQPRADIMPWKHRKLVSNLGNAVDAVCVPGDDATELTRRARAEGEAVLEAAGIAVVTREQDRERRAGHLVARTDDPQDEGRDGSSTYQSLARGGDTEVDHLAGQIVLLARLHGVPAPVNALLQATTHDVVRRGTGPRSVDAASLLSQVG